MWTIRQTATGWEVVDGQGVVLATEPSYDLGLAFIGTQARLALAAGTPLPGADAPMGQGGGLTNWVSGDNGIVLAKDTGDGRDFTGCTFTWRDPAVYPLPLMLQTETEMGHFGACLAGFITTMSSRQDGGVDARGSFHLTEDGEQAVAVLQAQGRMGVSVDPGAVEYEEVCTEFDPEGWCRDGFTKFLAYEVIGLTMTPFPAFADAWIMLDTAEAAPATPAPDTAPAVAASAGGPPSAAYFRQVEPPVGDPRYVDQGDGRLAVPLWIGEPDAAGWRPLMGHAAVWGTCHIGFRGTCVQPPESAAAYQHFHVGEVLCVAGERMATGTLVLGLDHAATNLAAPEARDHYAHTGLAWADVRASNGDHGVWISGVVRPNVTDEQLHVIRASALSGDWRSIGGHLEMVGIQSVNVPGFPIAREALAAAGLQRVASAELRAHYDRTGEVTQLAAAGIVRPARAVMESLAASGAVECAPCTAAALPTIQDVFSELTGVRGMLETLELRTRHLITAERDALRARLSTRR